MSPPPPLAPFISPVPPSPSHEYVTLFLRDLFVFMRSTKNLIFVCMCSYTSLYPWKWHICGRGRLWRSQTARFSTFSQLFVDNGEPRVFASTMWPRVISRNTTRGWQGPLMQYSSSSSTMPGPAHAESYPIGCQFAKLPLSLSLAVATADGPSCTSRWKIE